MNPKEKLIDSRGFVYESVSDTARALGISKTCVLKHLHRDGYFEMNGIIYRYFEKEPVSEPSRIPAEDYTAPAVHAAPVAPEDPLFKELKERYSMDELKLLAKGEGIDKHRIDYPKITLTGKHHRFLVMSDTHIGSVYSPEEWHGIVARYAEEHDVQAILHCGDLVDGLKIGRAGTQIYELSEVGYEAQLEKAISIFSRYTKPVYIISGNHDMYFKEFAGANIVKAFADALPNVHYIGHDSADISVGGCVIRLFHGGDGSSYAVSYRLQKLVESINGGHKPAIMLCGHVHKFCYILERNIHAISVPCMQAQTSFMRGKKLAAHTGFLILDFDSTDEKVHNLSVQYFPFYA